MFSDIQNPHEEAPLLLVFTGHRWRQKALPKLSCHLFGRARVTGPCYCPHSKLLFLVYLHPRLRPSSNLLFGNHKPSTFIFPARPLSASPLPALFLLWRCGCIFCSLAKSMISSLSWAGILFSGFAIIFLIQVFRHTKIVCVVLILICHCIDYFRTWQD